jgi:co-chaperonin GroES (HSP10)
MLTAPLDDIIIKVKTKYISNITTLLKRSAIQNNASVDPMDYVNITGEVISIPKSITKRFDYEGYSTDNIKVGDTAIFSYHVIGEQWITEDQKIEFKNRIWYNGQEYFRCNIMDLFGVIRDDKVIMLNGYVMATTFPETKIILAASSKKEKGVVSSVIMNIGYPKSNKNSIDAKQGDTILFNPLKAQKYQINDKPFIILSQHHIMAKES